MDKTELECVAISGLEASSANRISIHEIRDIVSIAQPDAGIVKTFRSVIESTFVDKSKHAAHA